MRKFLSWFHRVTSEMNGTFIGTFIQGLLFYLAAEISAYCSSQDFAQLSGNVKFIVVIEMEYINHFNVIQRLLQVQ